MQRLRATLFLLLIILIVPSLALAARKAKLVGKIVDPDGKPIQGVMVTATSPDIPSFKVIESTDKKGVFEIEFEKIDVTYVYRFDKSGYDSSEATQQWSKEGSQFYTWTIQPAKVDVTQVADVTVPMSTSRPAVEAFNTGLVAFRGKDFATAETNFKKSVENDPNLRPAWEALAAVQLQVGHHADAAASAEKAIALGSTQESVFLTRWQAYKNLKDEARASEAQKDLERIGRATEEAKKFHNEAVALVKSGDHAGAFAKFGEALKLDPNLQVSLIGMANAATKIGKNKEAAEAAETILKSDPSHEQAIRIRYNALLAMGDKTKLLEALQDLAPYEPTAARDGILRLAFEAYDANDLRVSKERFEKALLIDPNYPQAYYYLGVIDAGNGQNKTARKNLLKFLELAPNDPEAKSAREMLEYVK